MPLYENRKNAGNIIKVSENCRESFISGTENVVNHIKTVIAEKAALLGRAPVCAFDGWYGVNWSGVISLFPNCAAYDMSLVYKAPNEIAAYKKPFLTDDPGFGYVNSEGHIIDIIDREKLGSCKAKLAEKTGETRILYGYGAAIPETAGTVDLIFYFDKTRQPILWDMWEGRLVPFGEKSPNPNYNWKEYYYCDYYLLNKQKEYLYNKMDFWIEAIDPGALKMMPRAAYDEIIRTTLTYPVKEIKIYQPGPWGAYRYKDLFDVPGLECNAWNELAGPELGIIVDIGGGKSCEMPFMNLLQYQETLLGKHLTENHPGLFPMDVWLDDGYFPKPEPAERISMPIHNHPSTDYVRRHFNEPLGRYETYYIAEAYEGANTWMGFYDDCDLEEFERKCRESNNLKVIEDWKEYIAKWDSNVGDLYLIPPGTAHGHGGNQMVLEMDTCPSVAGTEYSFFEYDFARRSWDDDRKEMTGKPLKMHLEHGFDNEKWRRASWVKDHLLAKPKVAKWTKQYQRDIYGTVAEMPFEIERFRFGEYCEYGTGGKFCQILTLTIGKQVIVRSKADHEKQTTLDIWQTAIIPAAFGEYEIVNQDGGYCEAVLLRWKKG